MSEPIYGWNAGLEQIPGNTHYGRIARQANDEIVALRAERDKLKEALGEARADYEAQREYADEQYRKAIAAETVAVSFAASLTEIAAPPEGRWLDGKQAKAIARAALAAAGDTTRIAWGPNHPSYDEMGQ